jgi:predicted extracellular nuclease
MKRWGILLLLLSLSVMPVMPMTAQAFAGDLFFSEYVEGSSFNKALEIYNGTGSAVDLGAGLYQIAVYFNGSASAGTTVILSGVVAAGDVFVFAQTTADPAILAEADQTTGSSLFNGDDAIALVRNGVHIDVIGQIGFDPGSEWGSGDVSMADNTIRRKASICAGDTNGFDVFDPSIEWDGFANNTFDGLGRHVTSCGAVDIAPQVSSTEPANGAADVAQGANILVNFSEAVSVTGTWFEISCSVSGLHYATTTGGPQFYVINPDGDFAPNDNCTLTVFAG